ncbi:5'-methylthioadenosine/S-adenosylhomocysteine nucleosidase [Nitratireductor sp. XY-223]|uniref:5'-methylthioadenosine/S-adenosylhomocysteine nucleosidase n=1 Tax=Nitratireductor sp. XY-223 TaxID=2561926 RepID=UPI0010AB3871|nr:5'-methylthioadenosine/S-adenosylhomocysteine nucleosidase [Nitratireductor sp. XY-223]
MKDRIKTVAGRRLFYVMAAEQEYGPALKERFEPLITGVGPVEAAIKVTAALCGLEAAGMRPDLVVSLGSAGSAELEQTGVYQVSSVSYRDMDASALGFEKGATPFLDLPVTVEMPINVPDIRAAALSTGANIVSGDAYRGIDAHMVDMETFAILRACHHFDIPLIGLRGISDGKEELKHVDDWTEYLHVIDGRLADAIDQVESAIENGRIAV